MDSTKAGLTDIFNEIDKDKSGFIDLKELEPIIKARHPNKSDEEIRKHCEDLMKAADKSGDQKISLDEFIAFLGKFE